MALVHGLTSGVVRGLARGLILSNGGSALPALVNGDFATNDLTGWTEVPSTGGSVSASSGALVVVSEIGHNVGVDQVVTGFTPGVTYTLSLDAVVSSNRATLLIYNNTVASGSTAVNTTIFSTGAKTFEFTPTVSDCLFRITRWNSAAVNSFTLDNLTLSLS